MIKNIIFDWSGTLIDNWRVSYEAAMTVLTVNHVKKLTRKQFRTEWRQPYMIFYRRFIPSLKFASEKKIYHAAHRQASIKLQSKPPVGMAAILKEFKKARLKLFVVSSDCKQQVFTELKKFNFDQLFLEVLSDVHDKKVTVEKIIKKFKFKPQETLFVGDTNHEIEVAKKLKIKAGAVTWGINTEEVLKKYRPDYIFHNIKEMRKIILNIK